MKKILFILSFLCTIIMVNAQQVTVSGNVSDSLGNGIQASIMIISDANGNPVDISLTDFNGNYTWIDTAGFFPVLAPGTLEVSTFDCNGNVLSQTHTYTPNLTPIIANFTSCTVSASCSVTMTTPVITGSTVTATATASGGVAPYTYSWDMGDGTTYNTATVNHTYNSNGQYLACVYITDGVGCTSVVCEPVFIGNPTSPCVVTITPLLINGNSITFKADLSGSGSTGTNSYYWDMGDGTTYNTQTISHSYAAGGTYNLCVAAVGSTGCSDTTCFVLTISNMTANQISGTVYKDAAAGTTGNGQVYLIEYDSIAGTLTAIDTVMAQQGTYTFTNVAAGNYLVKAALDINDPDYAAYLPTYFVQSLNWSNGQFVGPAGANFPVGVDIELVVGNNPGGPGFIGGLVVNGAGRPTNGGVTLVEDITNQDPMEGVSVLLLDANDNAVTHTVTDEDGAYSFANIAMGTYKVYVEELDKVTYPATVTIDASNLTKDEVHFTVNSNMVTLTGAYAVVNVEDFQVFPNPVYNTANIQLELKESTNLTLTVTNLMGQEFINQPLSLDAGNNLLPIETSELPRGLYMVSLKSETDVITYKIQKM